jgi:hypothetical protein
MPSTSNRKPKPANERLGDSDRLGAPAQCRTKDSSPPTGLDTSDHKDRGAKPKQQGAQRHLP